MAFIAPNLRLLEGQLIAVCTCAVDDKWRPRFRGADEAYEDFQLSLKHLRSKMGDAKYLKLLNMMETAREHFEAGHAPDGDDYEITLGARLMQDMGQVIRDRPPFAYPHDDWRWGEPLPINVNDLTAADV